MKRYERMSKEEIMDLFKGTICCKTCMFSNSKNECLLGGKQCLEGVRDYLNEEIKLKTVSRWQMIKSDEDLRKMKEDFYGMCNGQKCGDCSYRGRGMLDCFINYLLEKIEVEETE